MSSPLLCPFCRILVSLSSFQPGPFHIDTGFSKEFYYNTSKAHSPYSHCPFSALFLSYRHRKEEDFCFPEEDWLWGNFVHWVYITPVTGTVSLIPSARHSHHTALCPQIALNTVDSLKKDPKETQHFALAFLLAFSYFFPRIVHFTSRRSWRKLLRGN